MTGDSALVTGGSQGLGAVVARALHSAGHRVAITDLAEDAALRLAIELDPSGKTAFGAKLDVRNPADFERLRGIMIDRWGSVEILVNNAAITAAGPVLDIPLEEFDQVIAINLKGTFLGCQIFGRLFKQNGYGRIINIASLAGQNGGAATGAHYAASKGAILTLTKVFARDLARFGVTVNAVAPGPLDLPSVRAILADDKLDAMIGSIPAGTLGDPHFVADAVAMLASRQAAFATGATWDINGGLFMR